MTELRPLFPGGAGGARPSRLFSFQEDCVPLMKNTEPLGRCGYFVVQVTSDVAISKHLPLFTQTRQGLEKKK
jgi:hypothetical protein